MDDRPPFNLGVVVRWDPLGICVTRLVMGLMSLLIVPVGLGVALVNFWPVLVGGPPPLASVSWHYPDTVGRGSVDFPGFPLLGTGLGSFAAIHPYVKTHDAASTTAMSSLLQWGVSRVDTAWLLSR